MQSEGFTTVIADTAEHRRTGPDGKALGKAQRNEAGSRRQTRAGSAVADQAVACGGSAAGGVPGTDAAAAGSVPLGVSLSTTCGRIAANPDEMVDVGTPPPPYPLRKSPARKVS